MGMFAVLLVRRIGLAIGAWMATYYGVSLMVIHDQAMGLRQVIGAACGVATLAFFLPKPGISAKKEKE